MSALPLAQDPLPATALPPLVVDLDGTLTPTDTLLESVLRLSRDDPLRLVALLPVLLFSGRAAFKEALAGQVQIGPASLPYREPLLQYLREQRGQGRYVVLATAAHVSIAHAVAAHLGLFDEVIATEGRRNLKGANKLAACRERFPSGFVYAGDSRADLPVWRGARAAVLVGVDDETALALRQAVPIEHEFERRATTAGDWLRALRIHHWLKNLLVFVPLLTSFRFADFTASRTSVLAFLAFSLVTSATYLLNDLWDLDDDRLHERKRYRPLASGRIRLSRALLAAAAASAVGFALARSLGTNFALMLALYVVLTITYSRSLKRHAMLDVVALSMLYIQRILAGSAAIGVANSSWLLAFCAFTFLSLALAKRCAELGSIARSGGSIAPGRDYRADDLGVLLPMGVAAMMSAVVVFGLFISAAETQARYATPQLLWLVSIALTCWLGRLWIRAARGDMHDDPIVFALTDRASLFTVLAMVVAVVAARHLDLGAGA